ncbi:Regulator of nucleoside diphosphate kinase [Rubripirellula lacrimiformis]|uniref:Regulator of nucleoside diphosphate kinase n=1 Tax=Rubripirellula lacrimiformis TaxID=1930273 RepID=A0A517NC51_9BACT|nr:GreA/GreB family elongation factor [Rubripirellula lacrimiformis]QDT04691.1 Regulator of nucleoside diphosphate kinase [Rubripirellula lacrimiformis]
MIKEKFAVTQIDRDRLENLLNSDVTFAMGGERTHLRNLKSQLAEAVVVQPTDVQPDIITMNSTVYLLDLDRGETDIYTIVYPDEACIAEGKLSILSPLGTEVFGRRVGDTVSIRVAGREVRKRVEKLSFQPERVGAFHL